MVVRPSRERGANGRGDARQLLRTGLLSGAVPLLFLALPGRSNRPARGGQVLGVLTRPSFPPLGLHTLSAGLDVADHSPLVLRRVPVAHEIHGLLQQRVRGASCLGLPLQKEPAPAC